MKPGRLIAHTVWVVVQFRCFEVETWDPPPQVSLCICILLLPFFFSDGNITDNVCLVQVDDQDHGERFKSVFHWDMKSKDGAAAPSSQPLDEVREVL